MISTNQKTINKPIKLSGVGLHNGINAELVIKPASENFGIKFCRVDIDKDDLIPANFSNVIEPILCTKIANKNGISVSTVEHLMAAFYGEGIDNALVEVNASEIPILDGSASDFVEAIRLQVLKSKKYKDNLFKLKKR